MRHFMAELYRRLPFRNDAYHRLVHLLMQPSGRGIVQHCAIGKDRTGVGSALTLMALGADKATVIEDYLLTETTLTSFREHMLEKLSLRLNTSALSQFTCAMSAREEWLTVALTSIREQYGSPDRWLETEYGLGCRQREILRDLYLES